MAGKIPDFKTKAGHAEISAKAAAHKHKQQNTLNI